MFENLEEEKPKKKTNTRTYSASDPIRLEDQDERFIPQFKKPGHCHDFPQTMHMEKMNRQSGRTTQMVVNAVERAILTGKTSYIIVHTHAYGKYIQELARFIAGDYWRNGLIECVSTQSRDQLFHHRAEWSQIFRDHAAF